MRSRATRWMVASLSLALPTLVDVSALAQEQAPAPKQAETLEVRVIGDKADALQKIPGSGELITSRDIKRAQPKDLSEMLRRVPGVQTYQTETGGMRMDVGVRGLDATRGRYVLLLEDGVPVAAEPYGEPDLYFAPSIER